MEVDEVSDGLTEFNMDNYDEEDDDIQLFSSGIWDLYYPSNELDPTRFLASSEIYILMVFIVLFGSQVQAVAWNHYAPEVLLSWSFDQTVVLVCILLLQKDGKQPSHSGFKLSAMSDVESLAWNPHSEHSSVVSLEDMEP
ncbi:unnamed protein product [Brassica rapa]|uniref:Uncharacterized protein n=1 Tax=Brassica campestris TaxID=3711 RepID=A0A3P5ZZD6_BRACM|nr:unnamed protein product [Brassica rapa]VDC83029.1 unnamed protein product [Brassica rapa]